MAHVQTQTIARSAASAVSTLRLRGESNKLIDEHSAHSQGTAPPSSTAENPASWPVTRGVPDYRPLNRNQDHASRPMAATTPEVVFVSIMFTGVYVQALIRTGWQWAGSPGKHYFNYSIGGLF